MKKTTKTKTIGKKPRRYVRKLTYYVAETLPPQPRMIVDIIRAHGTIERSALLKELQIKLETCQPIPWLFSYHKRALIRARYFREEKVPVMPTVKSVAPQPTVPIPQPAIPQPETPEDAPRECVVIGTGDTTHDTVKIVG
jgi:hypothetical protein